MIVLESPGVIRYLKTRQLVKLYLKVKRKIENGDYDMTDLKKRRPYSAGIWYFRITKKYRALATKENNKLYVFKISDHQ